MVKEDYSEYDGIGREGNHSGMSSAQTTMKPTGDSGMSGHLCVEGTVIDSRVDDKNVMDSFLLERLWSATRKLEANCDQRSWTEFQ